MTTETKKYKNIHKYMSIFCMQTTVSIYVYLYKLKLSALSFQFKKLEKEQQINPK